MRPTTLFSNHEDIARAADAPVTDMPVRTPDMPVRNAAIGSRAFSMFNDLPDGALRASRGFHLGAKAFVAIAAAATFGAYVIAREARKDTPVVIEQGTQIEQAPSQAAPILPPEPVVDSMAPAPEVTPAPPAAAPAPKAVRPAPTVVKRAAPAPNPAVMPAPAPAPVTVQPAPTPVETPAPVERAPEAPVEPAPAPEAAPAPEPVVEAPPAPAPPAPVPPAELPEPAPGAPVPPPADPAPAPAPAN
jgi:hypothetical protein